MRTTVGLLVAAVLVLGGCSGESSPGPDDGTPTISTSDPTATEPNQPTPRITMPTVEAPDDSPMYAEFSEEAALEFLDYFWDVYSYFQASLDPETWQEVVDPDCEFCKRFQDNVMADGGYLHGLIVTLSDVRITEFDEDIHVVIIELQMLESSAEYFSANSDFIETIEAEAEAHDRTVYLIHEDGRWQMWEVL